MIPTQPKTESQIIARMRALFNELMKDSDVIPKPMHPVINNLVEGYLKRADPAGVRAIIERIRDEIIPWLLRDTDD